MPYKCVYIVSMIECKLSCRSQGDTWNRSVCRFVFKYFFIKLSNYFAYDNTSMKMPQIFNSRSPLSEFFSLFTCVLFSRYVFFRQSIRGLHKGLAPIGTTRPIPPYRRSCFGCIRWKDMSNPKRLRWNIVLTETYESRSAITNQSKHIESRAIGTTRPIPPNRRSCKV